MTPKDSGSHHASFFPIPLGTSILYYKYLITHLYANCEFSEQRGEVLLLYPSAQDKIKAI